MHHVPCNNTPTVNTFTKKQFHIHHTHSLADIPVRGIGTSLFYGQTLINTTVQFYNVWCSFVPLCVARYRSTSLAFFLNPDDCSWPKIWLRTIAISSAAKTPLGWRWYVCKVFHLKIHTMDQNAIKHTLEKKSEKCMRKIKIFKPKPKNTSNQFFMVKKEKLKMLGVMTTSQHVVLLLFQHNFIIVYKKTLWPTSQTSNTTPICRY